MRNVAIRELVGTKRKSRPDRRAYGTLWPNGEFSLCWPKEKVDLATERDERGETVFTSGRRLVSRDTLASLCDEIHTNEEAVAFYPPKGRKNGLKGITRFGKKMVRSGAALLQGKYGRFRLSFLTLTLPELTDSQLRSVAGNWGRVVNRFLQWLLRSLERQGLPTLVIGVSELQPQRMKAGSASVLHLHLCFVGRKRNRGHWGLVPAAVRKAWLRVLSNECGQEVESSACEELRMVKKSAEGYLGKYMSKGSADVLEFVELGGEELVPGQWWFCSSAMRNWIKAEMSRGPNTGAILEALIEYLVQNGFEGSGVWAMPCHIELEGQSMLVAWVGRLPKALWVDLRGMVLN